MDRETTLALAPPFLLAFIVARQPALTFEAVFQWIKLPQPSWLASPASLLWNLVAKTRARSVTAIRDTAVPTPTVCPGARRRPQCLPRSTRALRLNVCLVRR